MLVIHTSTGRAALRSTYTYTDGDVSRKNMEPFHIPRHSYTINHCPKQLACKKLSRNITWTAGPGGRRVNRGKMILSPQAIGLLKKHTLLSENFFRRAQQKFGGY